MEPKPENSVWNCVRKTAPAGKQQLSLTALFQKHDAQGRRWRTRQGALFVAGLAVSDVGHWVLDGFVL